MNSRLPLGIFLGLLALAPAARAQSHLLAEQPKEGAVYRFEIETVANGSLKVQREGKPASLPLAVTNRHVFVEKILAEGKGVSRKVARHYDAANSSAEINKEKTSKSLREERRLIVAQRMDDPLFCYAPAGPLTRSELELVAEHFDTLHLTGLLPGKEVAVNDTWTIPTVSAQTLCLFEGLLTNELTGKLVDVKDGLAIVAIDGKTSGIELGAMVNMTVTATAKFDLLKGQLVSLEWKQKDARDQGPVSPASEVESVTTLKRQLLAEVPKELARTALVSVPTEDDPPAALRQLAHKDTAGRYGFLHGRDWHVVGETDSHLVLRLLDRGDFVAQANLTWWKKTDAGKHLSPDEFKKVIVQSPGFELEEIVDAGEISSEGGRWIYRITARGDLDGIKVIQNFFVLAAPNGEQMIATFTMKPTNVSKVGTRDVNLVQSIEIPKSK